jgi:quercetin dioxygenase-like cupin family protein
MPFVRSADAVTYDVHGARFHAYVNPAAGSQQLCAWVTEIAAGTVGVPHIVTHEEVLRVLSGHLRCRIDDEAGELVPGDVAIVPAGAELRVDNVGDATATMWVTTSVGLHATLADGSTLVPPWAN